MNYYLPGKAIRNARELNYGDGLILEKDASVLHLVKLGVQAIQL